MKDFFTAIALILMTQMIIYSTIMFPVFQWRNPKANSMTYYSEFKGVLSFQKLDKYQ